MKNKQGYQTVNALMQNNGNPNELLKQVVGNMSDEQKQNLFKQCKGYGVPEQLLSQLQNMK